MKYHKIIKAEKALKRNKLFRIDIILSRLFSLTFGVVTFYGQDSGNFTMSINRDAYNRGIILSVDDSFDNHQARLLTDPVDEARDLTYRWLKIDEIKNHDGSYDDPDFDYVAYTFNLQNNGDETINVSYHITMLEKSANMDAAIRVLIIEDGIETMYQKLDTPDENGHYHIYPPSMPETEYFLSDTVFTRKTIKNFKPGVIKKYSVVVWIEGHDPDTIDDILGGNIKMDMLFSIENRSWESYTYRY